MATIASFREAVVLAKQSLQRARGTVLTGYDGSEDLLKTAEEIADLGTDLVAEMRGLQERSDKARPRRR